jgi:hypothetical protein
MKGPFVRTGRLFKNARGAHCSSPSWSPSLQTYNRSYLVADLTAGVIVGIVALPLAIAFAIASGVTPDRGLYTAIIAGFIISALGGSRVQIGGPELPSLRLGVRLGSSVGLGLGSGRRRCRRVLRTTGLGSFHRRLRCSWR